MRLRNIIFDWSGTLVDDLPAVLSATNYVFERAGLPLFTMEDFRREFCLPFEKFYKRYTPDVPMKQLEIWFHARFVEAQDSVCELPHARGFLESCRAMGMRTFLLSTLHPQHYEIQRGKIGFDGFPDRPYLGVLDKRKKINEVIEENGLAREETLFIGDMAHDVDAARHGGVHSCGVLTGYNGIEQLREAEPDLIVEHLGELRQVLERSGWKLPLASNDAASAGGDAPVATVGALIFGDGGKVLMIRTRKWSNRWGIPGGKIKRGEPSEEAMRRELREETGLEVDKIRFVMVQDCIDSEEFYRPAHFLLLNYVAEVAGPSDVTLNDEAQAFRWVPIEEALAMDLNEPTRRLIEEVRRTHGLHHDPGS